MGRCVLCGQQITTPLSSERLLEQMRTWLHDEHEYLIDDLVKRAADLLGSELDDELLDDELGSELDRKDNCIITGKKINVCVYCFTEHIFIWLKSKSVDNKVLSEYLSFFNFIEG